MKQFTVWATLLSPQAARLFVAGLVERGYRVGPAASSRVLFWEGAISTLVAIYVGAHDDQSTCQHLWTTIKGVLDEGGEMYHSVIIKGPDGSIQWEESNIVVSKLPGAPVKEDKGRFELVGDEV
jgi:hypothetical protein